MKILFLAACLAALLSVSKARATAPFNYKISDSKPIKEASIQIVSFHIISGMNQPAVRKVNAALTAAATAFSKEAKQCRAAAQDHPWGYKLSLEKVLLSEKYLSVVFFKSTVCAGSPDIEKEARVFSLPTGRLVPSRVLFKKIFPTAKLDTSTSTNKELIDLEDEMIETMISDSKDIFKNYDNRCDFYLRNTSYRIWMDEKNLILFPEFIQTDSFCQKEYAIHPEE